jgi:hypothetical protein
MVVAEHMDSDLREGIVVDKHTNIHHIHIQARIHNHIHIPLGLFSPELVVPPSPY